MNVPVPSGSRAAYDGLDERGLIADARSLRT
jgi:hypothetical protein